MSVVAEIMDEMDDEFVIAQIADFRLDDDAEDILRQMNVEQINATMKRVGWESAVAIFSRYSSNGDKLYKTLGKKLIAVFPTKESAEANKDVINRAILIGLPKVNQAIYAACQKLKGQRLNSPEAKSIRAKSKATESKIAWIFKKITDFIYGDVAGVEALERELDESTAEGNKNIIIIILFYTWFNKPYILVLLLLRC